MKKLLLLSIILASAFAIFSFTASPVFAAPAYQWAKTVGGTANSDIGYDVAVDSTGNVYSIGTFQSAVDFDPTVATDNRTSNGGLDIFITKYSSDGTYQWTKAIGGSAADYGYGISFDSNNNFYITGYFNSTVDFDPSVGVDNHTSANVNGEAFLSKYGSDGSYKWTKTVAGSIFERGNNITFDDNNDIYIIGVFNGTADFDPGAGVDNKTSNGGNDIFVSKYNTDGTYNWTKSFGGSGFDKGYNISFDVNNNFYLTGEFSTTVDFDPGVGVDSKTSNGSYDIFISKYNADGAYAWTKTFGGSGEDIGFRFSFDANNYLYLIGYFATTVDFDPSSGVDSMISNGSNDIFISKYNTDGSYVWTKVFGGSGDESYGNYSNDIIIDSRDYIYLTGGFQSAVDFDPSSGVDSKISAGGVDIFITSYNTDGTYRWTKTIGSLDGNERGIGIANDSSDNIYITGYFISATVDFDFTSGTDNHTSVGLTDIFIMKLLDDTTAPNISLNPMSDQNTDTTPTLTGTATDVSGIINTAEFQVDSTSGSWTACTADDGAFDEASEAFSCSPATALSLGSHTIYVRSTDSNSNTTLSGSESSDSFIVQTEAQASGEASLDLAPNGVSDPNNSDTAVLGEKTVTSSDEVSVNWGRPDDTSNIDEYVVHYREIGSSTWKTETAGPDADSISWDPGEGNWEWYLEIVYIDGSTSETSIHKFEVDQSSPENQLISIADEQMINLADEQNNGLLLPFGSPLIFNFGNTDWDTVIEIWNWDKTIHYTTMVCGSGICDHGDILTGPLTLVIYTVDEAGNESERREIKITPFGVSANYVPAMTDAAEVQGTSSVNPAGSEELAPGIVRGAVDIDTSINPTAINNPGIVSGAVDFPQPESRPEPPRQNIFQRAWHSIFK